MLRINIPAGELWDSKNECFVESKGCVLQLEHSLLSIARWESKWHKSFLSRNDKTDEETYDYFRCMTLNRDVDPSIYYRLTQDDISAIVKYIEEPMTATTFRNDKIMGVSMKVVTNEIIYYWMVTLGIPFDPCQKWHLNHLIALIRVCSIMNSPPKKMSSKDVARQNQALNAARRRKYHTKG